MNDTADLQVSSSDLVRGFGVWQERASREPVYVVHRGRPKLVLMSVEILNALCERADTPSGNADEQIAALVDAAEEALMLVNPDGAIAHLNRAARLRFASAVEGRPLNKLSDTNSPYIAAMAARVMATGTSEGVQLPSGTRPGRELSIKIDALPSGCVIAARDATAVEEQRATEARTEALTAAVEAAGRSATFILNQRGAIIEPRPALAAITGAAIEHLSGMRLIALVAAGDRQRVTALLDQTFETGAATGMQVEFLIEGARAQRAELGFAGVGGTTHPTEVAGTLTLI